MSDANSWPVAKTHYDDTEYRYQHVTDVQLNYPAVNKYHKADFSNVSG